MSLLTIQEALNEINGSTGLTQQEAANELAVAVAAVAASGGLTLTNTTTDNTLSIDQNGNVGTAVATDGAVHVENTGNTGIGLGVYTNIGATADASLIMIHADNPAFDQWTIDVVSDGVGGGLRIEQRTALPYNKRALSVFSDAVMIEGELGYFRLGSASATATALRAEHIGEGAAVGISATVGPHIQMVGDTPNSTPTDGDMWYDGTNLKFRNGGTTQTISWT